MKKITKWVIAIGVIFYIQGCASNSPTVASKDIKIENLYGAQYIGGKIWEDTTKNKYKKMNLSNAVEYCSHLNVLDTKGWVLPTIDDVENMQKDRKKLTNVKEYEYYHSSDLMCASMKNVRDPIALLLGSVGAAVISASSVSSGERCKYYIKSNGTIEYKANTKNALVRCVLDPDKYKKQNAIKQNHAKKYRNKNTYEDYLQAFKISKDIQDAKKAYALADSRAKKLQVEKYLVKNVPDDKLVDVTITGKGDSKVSSSRGDALKIISYAGSKKNISIKTRVSSDFLQYGKYKVTVEFTVKIPYKTTVKYFITATSKETRTGEKRETYILSGKNHYTARKTVSFNNIMVSTKMSIGSIEIMEGTTITAKIIEVVGVE